MDRKQIDPLEGFQSIMANTTDALIGAGEEGRIILFNPAAEQMFGYDPAQVHGERISILMPERYRQGHAGHVSGYFSAGQQSDRLGKPTRMIGKRSDGSEFPIELSLARSPGGSSPFVLAIIRDISERDAAERALQDIEQRYTRALHGSRDGIWDWDLVGDKVYYAPRWKELLGVEEHEIGDSIDDWLERIAPANRLPFQHQLAEHLDGELDAVDIEMEMRHGGGGSRWMLCRAVATRDESGKAVRLSGSLADITELKRTQELLRHTGLHDRLTGLPNRELLISRLEQSLQRKQDEPGHLCALLYFDFDRFKSVNDGLGHDAGDALLKSIAERLLVSTRECDVVSRFGGDEFVVLLDGVDGLDEVERICDRLVSVCALPHAVHGYEVVSTASIGIVMSDQEGSQTKSMLRDADAAMYQAKSAGKNRYRVFDKALHHQMLEQLALERDLRRQPFDSEMVLHYQPIIALESGELAGFEALVRWEHPILGLLGPDHFIPMAEETGLMIQLGEWVLRTACGHMAAWREQIGRDRPLSVSVNCTRRQLAHPGFIPMLTQTLEQTNLDPSDLKLEINESVIMDSRSEVMPVMREIQAMGIKLAMDDFGSGRSSLSCLHQTPINDLKIDRGFVQNMPDQREFAAVVHSIIQLASNLNIEVVAEGIENNDQLAQLQAMDCHYAQGNLLSKPMPVEQASEYLQSHVK